MNGHELRTQRLEGVDGSEWTVIGTTEGFVGAELGPDANEGVYTAHANTALPLAARELHMTMHVTDFNLDVWRETERRFREHMEFIGDGIREAAEQIAATLPAFEAASKAVKGIQQPSKTPPFWAHNPAKQKRPRR